MQRRGDGEGLAVLLVSRRLNGVRSNEGAANIINCTPFEELLTRLSGQDAGRRQCIVPLRAHAICMSALPYPAQRRQRQSRGLQHDLDTYNTDVTRLEARVLAMTAPETAMSCEDFEGYLTDYLDGFLPAHSFHRWERHAALCTKCEDLPGMVVRSIGACQTYKMEELAVPAGCTRVS